MVMEYISGRTLENAWCTVGWITTVRLALVLKRYIGAMRSKTSPTAGSLASGICRSFLLEDNFGLPVHARPSDIQSFINFWSTFVSMPHEFRRARKNIKSCPTSWVRRADQNPLVFTHHDLAPRNLHLDNAGQLWVLDWDYAGWYPLFFEYTAMYNFRVLHKWPWLTQLRWHLFVLLSCGWFSAEERALERIRWLSIRFGYARRVDIAHNLQPSSRPLPPD